MFDNIGKKLQGLAAITTIIGCVLSVISGIAAMVNEAFLVGLLVIVIGGLGSWIGSWVLYGFGTLIENSQIIADNLSVSSSQGSGRHSGTSYSAPSYSAPQPEAPRVRPSLTEKDSWVCPKCQTRNSMTSMICKDCGHSR